MAAGSPDQYLNEKYKTQVPGSAGRSLGHLVVLIALRIK